MKIATFRDWRIENFYLLVGTAYKILLWKKTFLKNVVIFLMLPFRVNLTAIFTNTVLCFHIKVENVALCVWMWEERFLKHWVRACLSSRIYWSSIIEMQPLSMICSLVLSDNAQQGVLIWENNGHEGGEQNTSPHTNIETLAAAGDIIIFVSAALELLKVVKLFNVTTTQKTMISLPPQSYTNKEKQ